MYILKSSERVNLNTFLFNDTLAWHYEVAVY